MCPSDAEGYMPCPPHQRRTRLFHRASGWSSERLAPPAWPARRRVKRGPDVDKVYLELNITAIYGEGDKTWSMWLTEVNRDGDWEIKGFRDGRQERLFIDFASLVNRLRDGSDPIPSSKRFKRRR